MRVTLRSLAGLAVVLAPCAIEAQDRTLQMDPARTTVEFTLGATLHTVHGTFHFASGRMSFDPASGHAAGELVVDAASGQTGNASRDKKMHTSVIESARFPRIVFQPDRVDGAVAAQGVSKVQVHGWFEIHGERHEMVVPVEVHATAAEYEATAAFIVPFVKWGMKSPNTLVLRVDDHVEITVHTVAGIAK